MNIAPLSDKEMNDALDLYDRKTADGLPALCGVTVDGELTGVFAMEAPKEGGWLFGVKPMCLSIGVFTDEDTAVNALDYLRAEGLRLGCDSLRCEAFDARSAMWLRKAIEELGPVHAIGPFLMETPISTDCPILPIRMHPAYRSGDMTPWGGDGLKTLFGKDIPDERTGEALEISAIPNLESSDDDGDTLPELIDLCGDALVGEGNAEPFPLLLKLLCAKTPLSVQVHPTDDYALRYEHKLGKTEAWVILQADEGAQLVYGIKDGVTLEALQEGLESGADIEPMLATVPVKAGDVLYMPGGMVHAIGGGIVLYEIQQSSDVTYRLWDYNRVNAKGEKRPLHIRQSLDVIDPALKGERAALPAATDAGEHTVLSVPAFKVTCACANGELALSENTASFRMFTALDDLTLRYDASVVGTDEAVEAVTAELPVKAGESLLIAAHAPRLTVCGQGRALMSGVK